VKAEEPRHVGAVVRWIVAHPWEALGRRWNYKSAVLSSLARASLFFTANLSAGFDAAAAAFLTELCFRFTTAGFYGALTQAFRRVEPPLHGTLAALVLLPAVAHTLEWVVHRWRGTAELGTSIAASLLFTAVSTTFNLFAMRRGLLIVGDGGGSLLADLRRMPRLVVSFIAAAR
jgi:hypothetical protein